MKTLTKISIFSLLLLTILEACKKTVINPQDEIKISVSAPSVRADSISTIKVSASIPYNTTPDKQNITFNTSAGNFLSGTNGSITVKAVDNTSVPGKLTAYAYYTSTLGKGSVWLTATIAGFQYTDSAKVQLTPVLPVKLKLTPSAFTVKINFGGEVSLMGQLFSDSGNVVSRGAQVKFVDINSQNIPMGGSFRAVQNSSDVKGQVNTVYSPGITTDTTFVYLKSIYLDNNGNETNIRDSVKIYLQK
ncbi:MAG TPA: hypothetical protein VK808_03445 [Bacteroidia bacterium]|jgi:hypothetical protein|nr:hypothetical protein [Bacteroidia bacterium]